MQKLKYTLAILISVYLVVCLVGCRKGGTSPDDSVADTLYIFDEVEFNLPELLYAHSPEISPDGNKIVFTGNESPGNDIWILNVDGTNLHKLTNNSFSEFAVWFPTGDKLIFSWGGELHTIDTTGQILEHIPCNGGGARVSPDGKTIVYSSDSLSPDETDDIWKMNLETNVKTRLTDYEWIEGYPSWSIDGQSILYHSLESGLDNIWEVDSSGNNKIQITFGTDTFATWTLVAPCETPDEKWLVFNIASIAEYAIWAKRRYGEKTFCLIPNTSSCSFSSNGIIVYDKAGGRIFRAQYSSIQK